MDWTIRTKGGAEMVTLNRRKAIKAKCSECSNWNQAEVMRCDCRDCDLFPYRTGKGRHDAKRRAAAIRSYCFDCMGGQPGLVWNCEDTACALWLYRTTNSVSRASENDHIRQSVEQKTEVKATV